MNRYCQILWDWNGTLLDDVRLCVNIVNDMLTKRGIQRLDLERYKSVFDFPVQIYYERAGFDFSKETFDSAATEFCDEYERRVGECHLHDGAEELLKKCATAGIHQSILSTTEQNRLEKMVEAFGISSMFDTIVGQPDHHAIGKVQKAKELIASMEVFPNNILLIGDTTHDSCIAKEIGVDSVLVSTGHHTREKLEKTGMRVFDKLSDIEHLLIYEKNTQQVVVPETISRRR